MARGSEAKQGCERGWRTERSFANPLSTQPSPRLSVVTKGHPTQRGRRLCAPPATHALSFRKASALKDELTLCDIRSITEARRGLIAGGDGCESVFGESGGIPRW
eukprot:RCo034797